MVSYTYMNNPNNLLEKLDGGFKKMTLVAALVLLGLSETDAQASNNLAETDNSKIKIKENKEFIKNERKEIISNLVSLSEGNGSFEDTLDGKKVSIQYQITGAGDQKMVHITEVKEDGMQIDISDGETVNEARIADDRSSKTGLFVEPASGRPSSVVVKKNNSVVTMKFKRLTEGERELIMFQNEGDTKEDTVVAQKLIAAQDLVPNVSVQSEKGGDFVKMSEEKGLNLDKLYTSLYKKLLQKIIAHK